MGLETGSVGETEGERKGQGATQSTKCDAVCGEEKEKGGEGKPEERVGDVDGGEMCVCVGRRVEAKWW